MFENGITSEQIIQYLGIDLKEIKKKSEQEYEKYFEKDFKIILELMEKNMSSVFDDNYTEYKKGLPDVGNRVKTEKGEGKVISVDVFKRNYKVLLPDSEILVVEVDNESKE